MRPDPSARRRPIGLPSQGPMVARALVQGRANRAVLLLTTALTALPTAAIAQPAPTARPTGGQVVAGQASIAQTQARTTVSQSSQRAAIDWKGFDVGSAHTVQFAQPGASSVTMNRVTGPNPSEIAGRIEANGQVVIVNQAGVLFHKGAQIDTAGLVATASGISTGNFMAGNMVFDQKANPGAKVENRGTITIRDRGLAALVAPQVANSGVIRATMGTVMLAGAETHTLDLYGDGMVAINVTRQVRAAADGTKALVTNTGTIDAQGGSVVLTAEAVDGVVQTLVNAGGVIRADGRQGGKGGRIIASGRGGDVILAGTMAANGAADGTAPGGTGGTIVVNTTGRIALADGARVTASGPAGGGSIAIGTNQARTLDTPVPAGQTLARSVLISPGATLAADATVSGRGGIVTILSADVTRMEGAISARGVSRGGFVEVSGGRVSSATGRIDVSAVSGPRGTILIDPDFLDIVAGASGSGTQDPFVSDGTILASDASFPPDTLSTGVLNALTGDVLLQANKTISVKGDISLTNTLGQSLTLQAGGTIVIATGIGITASGDITVATGGAGPSAPPAAVAQPLISVQGNITSNTGTVSLLGGTGGSVTVAGAINAGAVVLDGAAGISQTGVSSIGRNDALVTLRSSGAGVTQAASATLVAATLLAPDGVAGTVGLNGTRNAVANLGSFAVTGDGNSFTLINTGSMTVSGPLTVPHNIGIATGGTGRVTVAGTIANSTGATAIIAGSGGIVLNVGARVAVGRIGLTATGGISLAAGASLGLPAGLVDFGTTAGGVTQDAGAVITAGTLRSSAGVTGGVSLVGTANAIAELGNVSVSGGDFALVNTGALLLGGTIAAPAGQLAIETSGSLAVPGGVNATSVALLGHTVDVTGRVASGGTGMVGIAATTGPLTHGGTIEAGTLAMTASGGSIALQAGAIAAAPTLTLGAAGSITIAPGVSLGQAGAVLSVGAGAGITQDAAATIIAATLLGRGGVIGDGVIGDVALLGTANEIGGIGSLSVTNGGFTLFNKGAVAVTGPLTATDGVALTAAGIGVSGTITAGSTLAPTAGSGGIALTAGSGGIALNTGAVVTAPTIDLHGGTGGITIGASASLGLPHVVIGLATSGGGVTQDMTGIIRAATLRSDGIVGSVALDGVNTLSELGAMPVTGDGASFRLAARGVNLRVVGTVTAPGTVTIDHGGTGALTIARLIQAGTDLAVTGGDQGVAITASGTLLGQSILVRTQGPLTMAARALVGQTGALVDLNAAGVTQDAGATLVAATLQSSSGIFGQVDLLGTANAIATLGSIAVTDGALNLVTTTGLTVAGAVTSTATGGSPSIAALVSPPGISIAADGPIVLASGGSLGGAGGTVDLSTTAGGVIQDPGAVIQARALTSSGGIAGSATLAGIANAIETLASFAVGGTGADLLLTNSIALGVTGPVSATRDIRLNTAALSADAPVTAGGTLAAVIAGGLDLNAGAVLAAPRIEIVAQGALSLAGGARLGQAGASVDLATSAGGIGQHAGATLIATTLASAIGVTGDVVLAGTANAVGTLSAFAVTGGGFGLVTTGSLVAAGPVTATGAVALAASGAVSVPGSIAAGTTLSITAGAGIDLGTGATAEGAAIAWSASGPITLGSASRLGKAGAVIDLATTSGGVTQYTTGTIIAASLGSTGGITGDLTLIGSNTIAAIGDIGVSGAVRVFNQTALTLAGTLIAGADAYLRVTDPAGITIGSAGRLSTPSAGRAGLHADALRILSGGSVATGEFAYGPVTVGATLTLGTGSAGIDTLVGVSATRATVGGISIPGTGETVTAGAIVAAAAFNANDLVLRLLSLGGIEATAAPLTNVARLTGSSGATTDLSHAGNTIRALEDFTAGGTAADLRVATQSSLTVGGTIIAARDIALTSVGAISVSGGIDASRDLSLGSASGMTIGATLTAGRDGALSGPGTMTIDGSIAATRDLVLNGGAALGMTDASVTAGGSLAVSAGAGIDAIRASLSAPSIRVSAAGPINLGTLTNLGRTGASIDVSTSAGGVSQHASGRVIADRLGSAAGIAGDLSLPSETNAIGTISAIAASGSIAIVSLGTGVVSGLVDAGSDIALRYGADLTVAGTIQTTGSVALTSGPLTVGSLGTVTGPDIAFDANGPITLLGGAVVGQAGADIRMDAANGAIIQATSGTLLAARLAATATGAIMLSGTANLIQTVGTLQAASGDATLRNAAPLRMEGPVSATGAVDIGLLASGDLTVAGPITAGTTIALATADGGLTFESAATVAAPNLTLSATGPIDFASGAVLGQAGAILDITTTGAITQDPAARLVGDTMRITTTGTGDVTLPGTANAIAALGDVTVVAGDFTLVNTSRTLRVEGRVGATAVEIDAGGLAIDGAIAASGDIRLASTGSIVNSGSITAGTNVTLTAAGSFVSSGTVVAGTGAIAAAAGGELRQTSGLFEAKSGSIALTAAGSGEFPLVLDGTVLAGVGLSGTAAAGSISLGGVIETGPAGALFSTPADFRQTGGTLTVPIAFTLAVPGTITQSAGTIRAVTLALTAAGGDLTQGATGSLLSADSGGRIDLVAGRSMSLAGQLRAIDPTVGDVTVRAAGGGAGATLTQNATILAGRSITLTVLAGDIVHGGTALADTVTFMAVPGNWTQSAGLIQARVSPFVLSVPGTVTQAGPATITALGSIGVTAGLGIDQAGTLTTPGGAVALLTQAGSLTASGAITAGQVRFTNPAGRIDVSGLITGLTPALMQRDSQYAIRDADFPTPAEQAGVFLTTGAGEQSVSFTAAIAATTGRGQVLVTIANDAPLSLTVDSRNADLFLSLGVGSAAGVLDVGSLHVRYPGKGTSETVDFAGTVNNLSGYTAASAAFILPSLKPNYQLNGCAIQAISCFQISDLRVPVSNPLKDVETGRGSGQGGVQFILPDVAERDY